MAGEEVRLTLFVRVLVGNLAVEGLLVQRQMTEFVDRREDPAFRVNRVRVENNDARPLRRLSEREPEDVLRRRTATEPEFRPASDQRVGDVRDRLARGEPQAAPDFRGIFPNVELRPRHGRGGKVEFQLVVEQIFQKTVSVQPDGAGVDNRLARRRPEGRVRTKAHRLQRLRFTVEIEDRTPKPRRQLRQRRG